MGDEMLRLAGELDGGLNEVEMGGTDEYTGEVGEGMDEPRDELRSGMDELKGEFKNLRKGMEVMDQHIRRIEQIVDRNTPALTHLQSTTLTIRSHCVRSNVCL